MSSVEDLRSDLSAARARNKDVLQRIQAQREHIKGLEGALEKAKADAKKRTCCQEIAIQRDALSNDVLLLTAENETLHLKLADYEGRIVALRDIVKTVEFHNSEIHNDNVLLRSAALGQEYLKTECDKLKNEVYLLHRQNMRLRDFNKQLLLEKIKK